jgi:hypothetical protein
MSMELKEVVMIAGKPGLYKIIGQRSSGLVVEALDGTSKKLATSPTQKISILSDIAIFTEDEEVKLAEVLKQIKAKTNDGFVVPDKKADDNAMRSFLETILPTYDRERVYVSDIRKLASWWRILQSILDFDKLNEKEEDSESQNLDETKPVNEVKKEKTKAKNVSAAPKAATKGKGLKTVTNRKQS